MLQQETETISLTTLHYTCFKANSGVHQWSHQFLWRVHVSSSESAAWPCLWLSCWLVQDIRESEVPSIHKAWRWTLASVFPRQFDNQTPLATFHQSLTGWELSSGISNISDQQHQIQSLMWWYSSQHWFDVQISAKNCQLRNLTELGSYMFLCRSASLIVIFPICTIPHSCRNFWRGFISILWWDPKR